MNYQSLSAKVDTYNGFGILRQEADQALENSDSEKIHIVYSNAVKLLKTMLGTSKEIGLGDGGGELRRKIGSKIDSVQNVIDYIEENAEKKNIELPKRETILP